MARTGTKFREELRSGAVRELCDKIVLESVILRLISSTVGSGLCSGGDEVQNGQGYRMTMLNTRWHMMDGYRVWSMFVTDGIEEK